MCEQDKAVSLEMASDLIRAALVALCDVPEREAIMIARRVVKASVTLAIRTEDRQLLEATPAGRA